MSKRKESDQQEGNDAKKQAQEKQEIVIADSHNKYVSSYGYNFNFFTPSPKLLEYQTYQTCTSSYSKEKKQATFVAQEKVIEANAVKQSYQARKIMAFANFISELDNLLVNNPVESLSITDFEFNAAEYENFCSLILGLDSSTLKNLKKIELIIDVLVNPYNSDIADITSSLIKKFLQIEGIAISIGGKFPNFLKESLSELKEAPTLIKNIVSTIMLDCGHITNVSNFRKLVAGCSLPRAKKLILQNVDIAYVEELTIGLITLNEKEKVILQSCVIQLETSDLKLATTENFKTLIRQFAKDLESIEGNCQDLKLCLDFSAFGSFKEDLLQDLGKIKMQIKDNNKVILTRTPEIKQEKSPSLNVRGM